MINSSIGFISIAIHLCGKISAIWLTGQLKKSILSVLRRSRHSSETNIKFVWSNGRTQALAVSTSLAYSFRQKDQFTSLTYFIPKILSVSSTRTLKSSSRCFGGSVIGSTTLCAIQALLATPFTCSSFESRIKLSPMWMNPFQHRTQEKFSHLSLILSTPTMSSRTIMTTRTWRSGRIKLIGFFLSTAD